MTIENDLLYACAQKNADKVLQILENHPDIHINICQNVEPVNPYKQLITDLIDYEDEPPENPYLKPPLKIIHTTPLILACRFGDIDTLNALLSHPKIDINQRNPNAPDLSFSNAFYAACYSGNLDVVKRLLDFSNLIIEYIQTDQLLISWNGPLTPNFFSSLCIYASGNSPYETAPFPNTMTPNFAIDLITLLIERNKVNLKDTYPFFYLALNSESSSDTRLSALIHLFIAVQFIESKKTEISDETISDCIIELLSQFTFTKQDEQYDRACAFPYDLAEVKKQMIEIQTLFAADLVALFYDLGEKYLQLKLALPQVDNIDKDVAQSVFSKTCRFFSIGSKLPPELQQVLFLRKFGCAKETIPTQTCKDAVSKLRKT
jgi:hypothetical protein